MKTTILASFLGLILTPLAAAQCVGDIAVDGRVDGGDLGVLLANWGPVTSTSLSRACDLDGNGKVDGADLGMLLANWGTCQPRVPSWATLVESDPNPAVVTQSDIRTAISATGLAWRVIDRGTGIEMLLVPPGTFQMGCVMGSDEHECYYLELPVHSVTLTKAFYLARYEVTQAQWTAKMGSNPSYFVAANGYSASETRPVEMVSWNMVQGFLGITGFRLPTEAEWEYACRAGTQTPFYNGSTVDASLSVIAWTGEQWSEGGQTHTVGGKQANAFGLHDMLGNVWEWVSNGYGEYPSASQVDPPGLPASSDAQPIFRGGSWGLNLRGIRSSWRAMGELNRQGVDIGFRVARNP